MVPIRFFWVLLILLFVLFFQGSSFAVNSTWEVGAEKTFNLIPRTKNLPSNMNKTTNTLDMYGISIKIPMLIPREIVGAGITNEAGNSFFFNIYDYYFLFDFSNGEVGFEDKYVVGGATKYAVSGATKISAVLATTFKLPAPWLIDFRLGIGSGTINKTTIKYSSYRSGSSNFPQKIRGGWEETSADIGLIYSAKPIDYLFGLKAVTTYFDNVFSDYPSSPAGTEGHEEISYSNSNLYIGVKGIILNNLSLGFYCYLPVENWLQGYEAKIGWAF